MAAALATGRLLVGATTEEGPHLHHLQQHVQPLLLQEHEAQLRPAGLLLGGQLRQCHGDALLALRLAGLHHIQQLPKDAGVQLVLQNGRQPWGEDPSSATGAQQRARR